MQRDGLLEAMAETELAHSRLAAALRALDDAAVREPSLLPGWSRGHVLAHLARNAESHVRMLAAASRGRLVDQYQGGYQGRAAAIETGAARPVTELVADVEATAGALFATWQAMSPDAWDAPVRAIHGNQPAWHCVFSRWRETEIHHVDLDIGYTAAMWPQRFAEVMLPYVIQDLPRRVPSDVSLGLEVVDLDLGVDTIGTGPQRSEVAAPASVLLAWLTGRPFDASQMQVSGEAPDLGPWA